MDEVRIISISVLIVIGILAIILYAKFKESKNYNKLKKINSLDIIEDEENQSLQFEKEEERKMRVALHPITGCMKKQLITSRYQ